MREVFFSSFCSIYGSQNTEIPVDIVNKNRPLYQGDCGTYSRVDRSSFHKLNTQENRNYLLKKNILHYK